MAEIADWLWIVLILGLASERWRAKAAVALGLWCVIALPFLVRDERWGYVAVYGVPGLVVLAVAAYRKLRTRNSA